jgi:hypothetical protein
LIWISLAGLSKNRDELPLVVLLTVVVNLQRFFTAIGRDSNDAASRDLRTLRACGLLATLSLWREPKTLLLLATESRTGRIHAPTSLETRLLLCPCCRKPWLLAALEPKTLLLLATESRTGRIHAPTNLETRLLLCPCCRKPWLLALPKCLLGGLLRLLHLLLRSLRSLLQLLLVLLLAELLRVPK